MTKKIFFTATLLKWFASHHRPMPWKGEQNPYLIWLSEIILQQTRVEQGLPYFEKFKAAYPKIEDLADAPEDEVLKLWEGLGYYSRARNLHFTAKYVARELGGQFPDNYNDILALKGVGPYTAAAIASFAYDLPHAVVDGNVYRVLSRFFGIKTPIDSTDGKKQFAQLAQEVLETEKPGDFNQAIMDFGASQCVPKNPDCKSCPLQEKCVAFTDNLVGLLPVKEKKLKKRTRFFHYLILEDGGNTFIRKRTAKDIWNGLYEFPMLEKAELLDKNALQEAIQREFLTNHADFEILHFSKPFSQQLTHQKIHAIFTKIQVKSVNFTIPDNWKSVTQQDLGRYAFPKIIDRYFSDKTLELGF